VGWDGQILFWQDIFDAANMPNDKESLPYTDGEPQAGFKLGPSAVVEFIPLAVNCAEWTSEHSQAKILEPQTLCKGVRLLWQAVCSKI